jgi:hypothetical protein
MSFDPGGFTPKEKEWGWKDYLITILTALVACFLFGIGDYVFTAMTVFFALYICASEYCLCDYDDLLFRLKVSLQWPLIVPAVIVYAVIVMFKDIFGKEEK